MTLPNPLDNDLSEEYLSYARSVLQTEIDGLNALRESLNTEFSKAIEAIHAMKQQNGRGRLIVAGIGKSGHVARKIAATLASTGTPAYFVHPGEASHGDMGMVTEHDVVLILSNSGENSELSDLIHYTRRYNITMIGMTSNLESSLAKHSDIKLALPKVPEACPNGLAPTTSTTMMIALGDALAVALLKRMGLTPEQYKVFHPGGKLGQKLMKVAEIMIPYEKLPFIDISKKMDEALIVLTEKNLGAVIVMQDDKLAGIITDGDLKRHMSPQLMEKPVVEIMSSSPKTIQSESLGVEAVNAMTRVPGKYLSSLLVLDKNNELVGMIRLQDCLTAGLS